jgi:hypothetical protein
MPALRDPDKQPNEQIGRCRSRQRCALCDSGCDCFHYSRECLIVSQRELSEESQANLETIERIFGRWLVRRAWG